MFAWLVPVRIILAWVQQTGAGRVLTIPNDSWQDNWRGLGPENS